MKTNTISSVWIAIVLAMILNSAAEEPNAGQDGFAGRSAPMELRFTGFELPRAYPGLPYYTRMAVVGGTWPYTFELMTGAAGARITRDRGEVFWTAGKEGDSADFRVKATDFTGRTIVRSWKVSVSKNDFHFVATPEKGGDNENGNGSIDKPWGSIQHALNAAKGSGTFYLRAGVYQERSRPTGAKGGYDKNTLSVGMGSYDFMHKQATREHPFHLASYPGEHAVVEPAGAGLSSLRLWTPFAMIENIELRNMEQMGINAGDYTVIRGCDIHGIHGTSSNCEAIWEGGKKERELVIQDCEIHQVRQPAEPSHACGVILYGVEDGLIEDNKVYGSDSNGLLDKDSGRTNTFRGNYVYDAGSHAMMILGQGHHWDCVIHDNVFSVRKGSAVQIGLHDQVVYKIRVHHNTVLGAFNTIRAEETTLWNNIFQVSSGVVATVGTKTPGFMSRRDVFWSPDAMAFKWDAAAPENLPAFAKDGQAKDDLFEQVRFADTGKNDFRLKGPPAVINLAGKNDYIGAHERVLAWVAGGAPMRSTANVAVRLNAAADKH